MTHKELVIQALIDHFPKGATVAEIRDFISNAYGRPVEQNTLRPQMHRLKADSVLIQDEEVWNLNPEKRRLYAMYNHPSTRAAMPELKDDAVSDPEPIRRRGLIRRKIS